MDEEDDHPVKVVLPEKEACTHKHKVDLKRAEDKIWECPADQPELDCTNEKIHTLNGLIHLTHLESLCLRQNEIEDLSPISTHDDAFRNLDELDLYGNKLSSTDHLHHLTKLTKLDLSFNECRKIQNLELLTNLTELFLVNNKISEIQGLDTLTNLTLLELGSNRIRELKNMTTLSQVRQLWLGRNKITEIMGLSAMVNLQKISMQSNRLTAIGDGLSSCVNLTELYLSHNGISSMKGLAPLINLSTLDLGNNRIEHVEDLDTLVNLDEIWISDNKFADLNEFKMVKAPITTIYLERNPLASEENYHQNLYDMFPTLEQIDADSLERLGITKKIAEVKVSES